MAISFSFRLSEDFVSPYKDKKPPFGYRDAAGNSVGDWLKEPTRSPGFL